MFNTVLTIMYILVLSISFGIIIKTTDIIKLNKRHYLVLTSVIFILTYLFSTMNKDYLLVPSSTVVIFLCFYSSEKKIFYSIFISILIQIIFSLSDAFTGLGLMYIFKLSYSDISSNKNTYFLTIYLILAVSFIISKLVNILVHKFKYFDLRKVYGKNLIFLTLYVVLVFGFIYLYLTIFKYEVHDFDNYIVVLNFLFITINVVSLFIILNLNNKYVKKNIEEEYRNKELVQLKKYTNMLEDSMSDMRKFRHDYINILRLIGSYIEAEDIEELRSFYKSQLLPESEVLINRNISYSMLKHVKIDPLKSFISSQIINAQGKEIEVRVEITEDICEVPIKLIDLCRIIGILLDNAIEAAELCHKGFIEFAIINSDDGVIFIINNSCLENTPPVHKIYERNFSTKGEGRGIGLSTVRDIINNYNNILLNTNIEEGIFKQELVINNLE